MIRKQNSLILLKEREYVIFLFFLSLIHPIFGILFYLGLFLLVKKQHVAGAIKYMIIVTMRGLLSTMAGVSLANFNSLKLIIFIILSIYILYNTFSNRMSKTNFICISCIIFCLYVIVASFLSGSYPLTSTFKAAIFGLVFSAVLKGMIYSKPQINWLNYFSAFLTPFFIISFFLIPLSSFRLVNSNFQGVFNHVNICGVMCALYITLLINCESNKKYNFLRLVLIIVTFVMLYLTASRTGMFAAILTITIYFITNKHSAKIYYSIIAVFVICMFIYTISPIVKVSIDDKIDQFIYKGNTDDIFSSRRDIQIGSKEKYENNKLFGSGFMTPYKQDYYSYSLDMSLIVEPGNIVWNLFGDVGIIGTILFCIFVFIIIMFGKFKNISLLAGAFGVCMGEMLFFSVNNMAVFIYIFLAIYIMSGLKSSTEGEIDI